MTSPSLVPPPRRCGTHNLACVCVCFCAGNLMCTSMRTWRQRPMMTQQHESAACSTPPEALQSAAGGLAGARVLLRSRVYRMMHVEGGGIRKALGTASKSGCLACMNQPADGCGVQGDSSTRLAHACRSHAGREHRWCLWATHQIAGRQTAACGLVCAHVRCMLWHAARAVAMC